MAVIDEAPTSLGARVRVAPSAVSELYAAVALIGFSVLRGDLKAEWVAGFRQEHADLVERLAGLYFRTLDEAGSAECTCWESSEILIYAQRSGTLLDAGLEGFFAAFDTVAQQDLEPGWAMPTEAPEVEAMVRERLERLRTDGARRAELCQVLRDVWDALRPAWEADGLAAMEADAEQLRVRLQEATTLAEVLPPDHLAIHDQFRPVVRRAIERRQLILTPLYFAGRLKHIVAFPGVVIAGFSLGQHSDIEALRLETADSAARFKLVSDPTRALMLRLMTRHNLSVSDLAAMLDLSQPTVSVHMKQLREAGLLDAQKVGTATLYRAPEARVREFYADAISSLIARSPNR